MSDDVNIPLKRILYTKAEVATMTGISLSTINRMLKRKELEFIHPGGTKLVRIPGAELDRLFAGKGGK